VFAIDHVIAVVDDLETAAQDILAAHGLASLPGGRHPGHGTGNRIVPLGDSYLELMAVVDRDEAAGSPLGRWAAERAGSGLGADAVCIRTDDVESVAVSLGEEPLAMSRVTDDGRTLSWRLAGLAGMLGEGLPFFIQWDTEEHPGSSEVDHQVAPVGFGRVGLPDLSGALAEIMAATPGIEVGTSRLVATIATDAGRIDL
jgi:hypothetical protein